MRGAQRVVSVVCAAVLVCFTAYTVFGLGRGGGPVRPGAARPGRLVVAGPEIRTGYAVAELELSLLLDSGQRLPLLRCDRLGDGAVRDEAITAEFDRSAALWLRFAWTGERAGRAELDVLQIPHPGALRAAGVFVEFAGDELSVRAAGREISYRLRGGAWERMETA